jgi:hypothetical protein
MAAFREFLPRLAASLNRDDAGRFVCDRAYLATVCDGNADGGRLRDAARPVAAGPGFLFWAFSHGGYVMGWAIAGVYWGEAADFLIDHKLTGRLFNTYEGGGYLM